MASMVKLQQKETGLIKSGYIGFSWTTVFFGAFPALVRGDFLTFIGLALAFAIISALTAGVGGLLAAIVWAFFYNEYYTKKLIEKGYMLADTEERNRVAAEALQIAIEHPSPKTISTSHE